MKSVRYLVLFSFIFHEISDSYGETQTKVNETLEIQTWSFTFWMNRKAPGSLPPLRVGQTRLTEMPGGAKKLLTKRRPTTTEGIETQTSTSLPSTTLQPTTLKTTPFTAETLSNSPKKQTHENYFWTYMEKPKKNDGMKWVSAFRQRFIPKLPPQRFKPPTTTEDPYPYDDDYSELEIEKNCGEGLIFFDGGCFPDVS